MDLEALPHSMFVCSLYSDISCKQRIQRVTNPSCTRTFPALPHKPSPKTRPTNSEAKLPFRDSRPKQTVTVILHSTPESSKPLPL